MLGVGLTGAAGEAGGLVEGLLLPQERQVKGRAALQQPEPEHHHHEKRHAHVHSVEMELRFATWSAWQDLHWLHIHKSRSFPSHFHGFAAVMKQYHTAALSAWAAAQPGTAPAAQPPAAGE